MASEETKIQIRDGGPALISGNFTLVDDDGNPLAFPGNSAALCRCGASGNKPFCDGSHGKIGFQG